MVLDQAGAIQPSYRAYDKKVAGVVSGAGNYRPAIVLDKQVSHPVPRLPIAFLHLELRSQERAAALTAARPETCPTNRQSTEMRSPVTLPVTSVTKLPDGS